VTSSVDDRDMLRRLKVYTLNKAYYRPNSTSSEGDFERALSVVVYRSPQMAPVDSPYGIPISDL